MYSKIHSAGNCGGAVYLVYSGANLETVDHIHRFHMDLTDWCKKFIIFHLSFPLSLVFTNTLFILTKTGNFIHMFLIVNHNKLIH